MVFAKRELKTGKYFHKLSTGGGVESGTQLPFENASFDKILAVNVIYFWRDAAAVVKEIRRVLRPGGHLLYADFRGRSEFPGWDAALADTQMRQVSERVINPEVLRGLENNSQRSIELIDRLTADLVRYNENESVPRAAHRH